MQGSAWGYAEPHEAPDVGELAARRNGYVTFGSLNNASKLNDEVLGVWARILREVEGARLVVSQGQERVRCMMEAHEIAADRVKVLGRLDRTKYFAAYNQIDIGLDPFPYNGAVTSCDAMWMGVPVVT